MDLRFKESSFLRSAAAPDQFLRDGKPQLVFAGRSNVGKSSVINTVLGRRDLAHVGASPGKTRQINYFLVDGGAYLVDLPGYGYAKVSREERARWGRLMERYFQDGLLTAGVLIVDIRHAPSPDDVTMHNWFRETGRAEIVVANKLDQLKPREVEEALSQIRRTLELGEGDLLVPFSARKGAGKDRLRALLRQVCKG